MPVNFLIAGVQKGGTTSLDAYLRQHPQLCLADVKEPHYFDDDVAYAAGPAGYHARFHPGPKALHWGEATPIYTWWPGCLERIRDYNPAMRLIMLLRDPIQRAWSQWRMEAGRGSEDLPLGAALRRMPAEPHRVHSYVARGLYAPQIRRMRSLFPEEQLCFIKSESFLAQPQGALDQVGRFLGVDPFRYDVSVKHHIGRDIGPLPEEQRRWLAEAFEDDVAQCAALLGWDCRDWLQ